MQFELPGPCCSRPSMAQVILCEIAFAFVTKVEQKYDIR
jgi:hypothetical protein